jgi:hypothetical protein
MYKTVAPITSANVESGLQATSTESFPSSRAPRILGVTNTQGWYRIHIHLGGNRHVILRAGSSHNTSKPEERRLRKRPKQREPFLDEPALLLPALQQPWEQVQPQVVAALATQLLSLPALNLPSSPMCAGQATIKLPH